MIFSNVQSFSFDKSQTLSFFYIQKKNKGQCIRYLVTHYFNYMHHYSLERDTNLCSIDCMPDSATQNSDYSVTFNVMGIFYHKH